MKTKVLNFLLTLTAVFIFCSSAFAQDKNPPDNSIFYCGLCVCPTINVSGDEFVGDKAAVLTFTANVSGGTMESVAFNWEISAGKIIEGQGTPVIKVDIKKLKIKEITATLDIGKSNVDCEGCRHTASFTIKIEKRNPK